MKYLVWRNSKARGVVELDTLGEEKAKILHDRLIENECEIRFFDETDLADSVFRVEHTSLAIEDVIKENIVTALKQSNFVQKDVAILLGIKPATMCRRCAKFGIKHESWRQKDVSKKPQLKIVRIG